MQAADDFSSELAPPPVPLAELPGMIERFADAATLSQLETAIRRRRRLLSIDARGALLTLAGHFPKDRQHILEGVRARDFRTAAADIAHRVSLMTPFEVSRVAGLPFWGWRVARVFVECSTSADELERFRQQLRAGSDVDAIKANIDALCRAATGEERIRAAAELCLLSCERVTPSAVKHLTQCIDERRKTLANLNS